MSSVNNNIPFVPENTIDPAAGLNESILTIDALLQLAVVSVGDNTPPGSPTAGSRYIVGTSPTGAWAGRANQVAQWLDGAWRFFTTARYALNTADGLWYVRQSSAWSALAGGAPAWGSITGTLADQTDLQGALDGKVGTGDSRLTDAREWSAQTVSQAEAEAGTATTRRAWTAQRVRQAIVAWWNSVSSAWGRIFVSSADAAAGRTALELGNAATRTALGTTGALYSRDSILGTVSQSAGVPTGAIIERGSNANGEYVRFADGTQICWNRAAASGANAVASGPLFSTPQELMSYPAAFASAPAGFVIGAAEGRIPGVLECYQSQCAGRVFSTSSSGLTYSFGFFVVGRWY